MSIRNTLLALVQQSPAGVHRLEQLFEEDTGGALALNIAQVHRAMQRLERDGFVTSQTKANGGRDAEIFEVTDAGRLLLVLLLVAPHLHGGPA